MIIIKQKNVSQKSNGENLHNSINLYTKIKINKKNVIILTFLQKKW